jgi:hypothetical protein
VYITIQWARVEASYSREMRPVHQSLAKRAGCPFTFESFEHIRTCQ